MSDCRNEVVQLGCFTPTSGTPVTVKYVTVFDDRGANIAEYYADATGATIDPATYLGGGIATLGACEAMQVECVESQEWTYGIDNTGTIYNDVATYCFVLSDGSTLEFTQDGTASSWSPQLIEWAANIQAAADGAGLAWFAEPRYVTATNLTGGGGGLAGAPSETIGQGLYDGGMRWRYLNIQVCAGQPVPVRAFRKTSATYGDGEFDLTAAGAFLGPINSYKKCVECGTSKDIYYVLDEVADDGSYREAIASEIPKCPQPCGTLALAASPPDRDCTFQTVLACDSNNSTLTTDFIPDITRRATICNGQQIAVDYFQADPADPNALIPYTLVDRFVDCNTGEETPLPVVPCENFEIITAYSIDDVTPGLIRSEYETGNANATSAQQGDDALAGTAMDAFDASAATVITAPSIVAGSFQLNDTTNSVTPQDIEFKEGYIIVDKPISIRWNTNSEGALRIELGLCCGELVEQFTYAKPVGVVPSPVIDIPAGIHKYKATNLDFGGSNSNWNAEVTTDGINFSTDNTPDGVSFSATKPSESCAKLRVCEDSLIAFDLFTGLQVDLADYYPCSLSCGAPSSSGGGSAGGTVSVDNFPDQCEETDTPLTVQSGTGNVPAGFKSVTINNITGTTTINGGFQLGTGRRVDSISFGTDRGNCVNELLPAYTLTGGSWQWIGHRE